MCELPLTYNICTRNVRNNAQLQNSSRVHVVGNTLDRVPPLHPGEKLAHHPETAFFCLSGSASGCDVRGRGANGFGRSYLQGSRAGNYRPISLPRNVLREEVVPLFCRQSHPSRGETIAISVAAPQSGCLRGSARWWGIPCITPQLLPGFQEGVKPLVCQFCQEVVH